MDNEEYYSKQREEAKAKKEKKYTHVNQMIEQYNRLVSARPVPFVKEQKVTQTEFKFD